MAALTLTILPVLLIGGILFFLYYQQKHATFRGVKAVISGYFAILILSTIVYYLLPDTHFIPKSIADSGDGLERYEEIYTAAMNGTIDEVDGVKQKHNWTMSLQDRELDISALRNSTMMTVFERTDHTENQIEIIYYVANAVYGGVDFFDSLPLPTISLEEVNQLKVDNPKEFEIALTTFHKDFVISQFKGGGIEEDFNFDVIDRPSDYQLLYIKIPKDLELIGMDYVNFVGEEE